ncbi:MAG: hypothetical protein GY820_03760 [Gammaproteobacteria bacterium]|nr:hypothetical protein [Gammaproteobacteria bacterium]
MPTRNANIMCRMCDQRENKNRKDWPNIHPSTQIVSTHRSFTRRNSAKVEVKLSEVFIGLLEVQIFSFSPKLGKGKGLRS